MATSFPFKIPSIVPQDLQLIQDIIGEITGASLNEQDKTITPQPLVQDDSINSSDSDSDSEREVEANILAGVDEDDSVQSTGQPADSTTDSDSDSDSDSDDDATNDAAASAKPADLDIDDLEEAGPAVTSETQLRTKNEISEVEADIRIPESDEVGPDEKLEKVGEVMSIIGKVVIVKGSASEIANRASERALDSDTLLVFEDRKVLGHIYETFGPTTQPLYQVRFNQNYPLDPEKVQLLRPVFHVPERSNFVFVRQLQRMKGSDASNVFDEEPAEDELEFSDDEAEAAYKRALADRREQSRARSVASSRHSTPVPSRMHDQDMTEELYGVDPYSDPGPYDVDFGAGPSRPPPVPYDDPYSDSYGVVEPKPVAAAPVQPAPTSPNRENGPSNRGSPYNDRRREWTDSFSRDKDRKGLGTRPERGRGRGRGRDRDRGRGNRGRGQGRGRDGKAPYMSNDRERHYQPHSDNVKSETRSLSPTSLAIARATGQYADGSTLRHDLSYDASAQMGANGWLHSQHPTQQQQYDFSFGYQNQFVQPHINPRFASSFGMSLGYPQGHYGSFGYQQSYGSGDGQANSGGWDGAWDFAYEPNEENGSKPKREDAGS